MKSEKKRVLQEKTFLRWVNSKIRKPLVSLEELLSNDAAALVELVSSTWDGFDTLKGPLPDVIDAIYEAGLISKRYRSQDLKGEGVLLLVYALVMELLNMELANIEKSQQLAHAKKREFLVHWLQQATADHRMVNITDFTYSWRNGNALYALFDHLKPQVIDYEELLEEKDKDTRLDNTDYVLDLFTEFFGVPKLLDADDLWDPEEKSVVTFVVEVYNATEKQGKTAMLDVFVNALAEMVEMRNAIELSFARLQAEIDDKQRDRASCLRYKLDTICKASNLKSRLKTVGLLSGCEDIFSEILEIVMDETLVLQDPESDLKMCEDRFLRLLHGSSADAEGDKNEDLLEHVQLITKMSDDLKKINSSHGDKWDESREQRVAYLKAAIQDKLKFIQREIKVRDMLSNTIEVDSLAESLGGINLEELDYVFNKFDTGAKGYLTKTDLRQAVLFIYAEANVAQAEKLFEELLKQKKRVLRGVYFDEFVAISKAISGEEETHDVAGPARVFWEISNDPETVLIKDLQAKYGGALVDRLKTLMILSGDRLEYAVFFNGGFKNLITPKELFLSAR